MPTMNLLKLSPSETLSFAKSKEAKRTMHLTNISGGHVAFKVKTTAPKAYLVRPSSGNLAPGDSAEVQIILHANQDSGSPLSSHRFLVQAMSTSGMEAVTREAWADLAKDKVHEQRLSVVEESEEGASGNNTAPAGGQAGAGAAVSTMGAEASKPGTPEDLKVKYDELVRYALQLEKEKSKTEAELAHAQKSKEGGSSGSGGGYTKVHIILVFLMAFALAYGIEFMQNS